MKFVSLVSSGIDSPVATYLLADKADEIVLVHADNRPFTDDREIKNFMVLAQFLHNLLPCKTKAYMVPHGESLNRYTQNSELRFTCVFCKRMMLRYAQAIALKEHASAIIMGDSLGQVASQTLQNIRVVEQAVSIPIFRPLIGLDKEDVVRIAKEIGTYDLSIVRSAGCTAVPEKPSTRAHIDDVEREEKNVDVAELVNQVIHNMVPVSL
jgi:tRNA uracil 4-sulfurtransferase